VRRTPPGPRRPSPRTKPRQREQRFPHFLSSLRGGSGSPPAEANVGHLPQLPPHGHAFASSHRPLQCLGGAQAPVTCCKARHLLRSGSVEAESHLLSSPPLHPSFPRRNRERLAVRCVQATRSAPPTRPQRPATKRSRQALARLVPRQYASRPVRQGGSSALHHRRARRKQGRPGPPSRHARKPLSGSSARAADWWRRLPSLRPVATDPGLLPAQPPPRSCAGKRRRGRQRRQAFRPPSRSARQRVLTTTQLPRQ
jgi:hypothetical protein